MKALALFAVCIALVVSSIAAAQCTSQTIGGTTFHNFNNGVSGTSQDVGTTTFHNLSNGVSGSSI